MKCRCGAGCPTRSQINPRLSRILNRSGRDLAAEVCRSSEAQFCCPLCLRFLPHQCATVAHFPARQLGGRNVTVLCKACNNYIGTALESTAVQLLTESGSTVSVTRVRIGRQGEDPSIVMEGRFSTDPTTGDHALELNPVGGGRGGDTPAMAYLASRAEEFLEGFSMDFVRPSDYPVNVAFLAWSYLHWFGKLGYSFALSPALTRVRATILEPESRRTGRAFFYGQGSLELPLRRPEAVLVQQATNRDAPERNALELLGVGSVWKNWVCVLPLAADREATVYDHLDLLAGDQNRLQAVLVEVPFDDVFPEARSRKPGERAGAGINTAEGGVIPIVGLLPGDAEATLRDPFVPPLRRASPRRRPRAVNRSPIVALPVAMDVPAWSHMAASVVASHASAAVSADVERLVDDLAHGVERWSDVEALVPLDVRSHLEDAYRLLVRGEPVSDVDSTTSADIHQFVDRLSYRLPGHAMPVIAFSQFALGDEGDLYWCRADVEYADHAVVLGPFYTLRTLLVALRVHFRGLAPGSNGQ